MNYNTEEENLQLWKCHPEKICINCLYINKVSPTSYVSDDTKHITLYCAAGRWTLSRVDCVDSYIECLLTARVCKAYEYIDSFIKVTYEKKI